MTSHSTPDDGSSDGTAAVHVNGGIVPYTYLWSPGGNTTDSIFNKAAGSYCCLITDANGCIDSMCVTINSDAGIDNVESGTGEIMVYPNPSNGVFTIMLNCSQISSESAAIIEVYNELGEKVYYGTIAHSSSFIVNLSSQPNGIYACSVITEKGVWLGSCKLLIQK